MQKEKIEIIEPRMLTDGREHGVLYNVGRAGRGFVRIVALGVAIFALIFMMCCFYVGFSMADAADVSQSTSVETTVSDISATSPDYGRDMMEILKQMLGLMAGGDTDVTLPAVTDTSVADSVTAAVTTENTTPRDIYYFDHSAVPEGETAIVPYDLSLSSYGESFIYNDTSYAPSVTALLEANTLPKFDYINAAIYPVGEPVVLIIHTHGTEAYSPEGSVSYDGKSDLARSSDITQNVVAVGSIIAEVLNENNIRTLHCPVMHDAESYKDSYNRSAATIREYLAKYPSIQYIIDVHRDSVTDSSGSILRPVTLVDGEATAQVMCVVGSDYGGANHPDWQNNFSFALKLRSRLNAKNEKLCRPVYLRSSAYNQQYAPVSLLLEVGTSGNYLSEAKAAARLCAEALVDIIKN